MPPRINLIGQKFGRLTVIEQAPSRSGYNKCDGALHFHHKNPLEKEFAISQVNLNSEYTLNRLYKEVDKCELLCANCHAEVHYNT